MFRCSRRLTRITITSVAFQYSYNITCKCCVMLWVHPTCASRAIDVFSGHWASARVDVAFEVMLLMTYWWLLLQPTNTTYHGRPNTRPLWSSFNRFCFLNDWRHHAAETFCSGASTISHKDVLCPLKAAAFFTMPNRRLLHDSVCAVPMLEMFVSLRT